MSQQYIPGGDSSGYSYSPQAPYSVPSGSSIHLGSTMLRSWTYPPRYNSLNAPEGVILNMKVMTNLDRQRRSVDGKHWAALINLDVLALVFNYQARVGSCTSELHASFSRQVVSEMISHALLREVRAYPIHVTKLLFYSSPTPSSSSFPLIVLTIQPRWFQEKPQAPTILSGTTTTWLWPICIYSRVSIFSHRL